MFPFYYQNLILPSGNHWAVATFTIDFNGSDYNRAKEQAMLKSQFTMAASQAGENRPAALKYQRQLMGCLAEIGVQSFLMRIIQESNLPDLWSVRRYDDIRTDGFGSAANEWDLRIYRLQNSSFLSVECRSSILHNRSLLNGLTTCNIIGPYSSVAKSAESYKDIYFLTLFSFLDYDKQTYNPLNFEGLFVDGRIQMNLAGGCLRNIIQTKGIPRSMGQGSTQYQTIQILNGTDANNFGLMTRNLLLG